MARAKRFEELIAWQKARVLTRSVYEITAKAGLTRDRSLGNQMRAAAVSVMSNVAEGYERGGLREFHRFLFIAKGSCAELRSQFYVALDAGQISPADFSRLYNEADEAARVLGGLRAAVGRHLGTRRKESSPHS